jgi:ubiquinone/menaquinone biosynthesis C-methylase UbiE
MSRKSFENYGKLSASLNNHTAIAGRYPVQEEAEKNILPDIIKKLHLNFLDNFLEIGCGTGNLLIPVAFLVRNATGIDHTSCLKSLRQRCDSENKTFEFSLNCLRFIFSVKLLKIRGVCFYQ